MADPDAALANMENLMRRYEEMRATGKIDGGDSDDDGSDAEGDVPDDFDEGGGWIDDGSDDGSDDDDDLDVDDAREDRELTPEEAKREFLVSECVRMLSSGAREKKFVGMLLATKIGDADARALERVARAKSFSPFLTSMLRAAPAPVTAEDLAGDDDDDATTTTTMKRETIEREREERARSSHALSLAVCAALCRSPRVAARDDMLERLPLFINAMMRRGRYASISPAGVHDACEAVTAIVSSGKEDAEAIAAEGGALVACSIAIRDAAAETRGDGDGDGDGNGDENGGNPDADARFHPLLPAMTLLARLLEIPAIAAEIEVPGGVGGGGVDEKNQSRSREARAVAQATPALAAVVASRPGTPLAIEALRCLAMILSTLPARAAAGPSGGGLLSFELRRVARKSGGGERDGNQMLDDLRGGVACVLRSKSPREIRLLALDLCAAATSIAGPRWLCRDDLGRAAAAAGRQPRTVPFYRLALELTRVELAVTLHDLTRDDLELRQRARAMLSVPLVTFERLVAALAIDASAEDEDFGGGGGKSLMSAETAHAAVTTLADAAGALIDFLELYAHSERTSDEGSRMIGSNDDDGDDTAASAGESGASDPAVVLAVLRAASSFLAELPDAHERRVNALLPALLRGGGKGKGKGFGDDDDDGATVTTEATRSLSVRFLLPYLLQATETPAGLDAFAAADGANAIAFLVERACADDDDADAVGVLSACVATFRNVMEGAATGQIGEDVAEDVAVAFGGVRARLSAWAKKRAAAATTTTKPKRATEEEEEEDDFVRAASALDDGVAGAVAVGTGSGWRETHDLLERLVPSSEMADVSALVAGGVKKIQTDGDGDGGGGGGDSEDWPSDEEVYDGISDATREYIALREELNAK